MSLTVRSLHAGTLRPAIAALMGPRFPRELTCRCWLVETSAGLVLVEVGFGTREVSDPRRLGPGRFMLGLDTAATRPIVEQLPELGYRPEDVTHIIPTHLDLDHAGGIADFPHATVHCLRSEHSRATRRPGAPDKGRYRSAQVDDHPHWSLYDVAGDEPWFGLPSIRKLNGLPEQIVLVPLPGHSAGHTGVAVETTEGWNLHAGDAYFESAQLCAPKDGSRGLTFFRRLADDDHAAANRTLNALREVVVAHPELAVSCYHDAQEAV